MLNSFIESAQCALGKWQTDAISHGLSCLGRLRAATVMVQHPHDDLPISIPYLRRTMPVEPRTTDVGSWASFDVSADEPANEPIVFVHGFGDSKEIWLFIVTVMKGNRPVLLLDLPSFGAASVVPAALTTPAMQSAVVKRALEALGIRRAHLVGFSMGGGVALHLASHHVELVSTLALISSVGPYVTPSDLTRSIERGINPLVPRSKDEAERMFKFFMHRTWTLPQSIIRFLSAERLAISERLSAIFDHLLPALLDSNEAWRPLQWIRAPCLVICGQQDRIIHPDTSRALAKQIAGAKLVELPNVGHAIPVEAAWAAAKNLDLFLRASNHTTPSHASS